MKSTKLTYLLVLGIALTFAATGCKHKPVGVTPLPGSRTGQVGGENPTALPPGGTAGPSETPMGGGMLNPDLNDLSKFDQDRAKFAANMVHFDFDSAVIKSSEKPNMEAVAAFMKSDSSSALLIEGHCDERGTEEYNRSLGERRALALREALVGLGVDPNKVTTRSFGKDQPVDRAHNESAWKMNRRGEFVVLHPKS
jgi:peptidoglycan-associated lipoprotein